MSRWGLMLVVLGGLVCGVTGCPGTGEHPLEAPDPGEVHRLQQEATEGNAAAQYTLGLLYHQGQGAPQNDAEAVQWYRRAADQGYALAQHDLGVMYTNGQGVPQDFVQAHLWLNLAAASLPPGADRDAAVRHRGTVAQRMTPAQLARAQELASQWQPQRP